MNKYFYSAAMLATLSVFNQAQAASCRVVHWKPGEVIQVKSAMYLGTRVELPSDIVVDPVPSSTLWNVEGAASQVMMKPNSLADEGQTVVARAYTTDGNAFEVMATRVPQKEIGDLCVRVQVDGMFFSAAAQQALAGRSVSLAQGSAMASQHVQQLQQQLADVKRQADDEKRKAVVEALRRFRYHVYTRYTWSEGKGFAANKLISDVYDDGRFTYIRLDKPNRGLMSVETEVGEKNAVVPTTYDDAYGMYVISGIYPKFTMRVDDAEVKIGRADNRTHGEF